MSPPGDPPGPERDARASLRPALLAWTLVGVLLSGLPYARAHLAPPPGREFTGAFYFPDDVYNYLGYVEQAARGAFLLRNKAEPAPHSPALVNLEWWGVGRLSALLGGRPLLAWRLFALAASLAFVLVVDAALRRAGLPPARRLPALLLVLLGGGPGAVLQALRWPRGLQPLDLTTGLFPFLELLANPHFVLGTTLLLASLLLLAAGGGARTAGGVAVAAAAGLVRPYDLALAAGSAAAAVAFLDPPRLWPRRLAPLLALLPVAAYLAWVFFAHPAYRTFIAEQWAPPPLRWLALALAPALALALASRPWPAPDAAARRVRAHLWAWVAAAAAVAVLRPVPFSLQFLAGAGTPLLGLAALGLARHRAWVTLAAAAALGTSAVASARRASAPDGPWFVPAGRMEAARGLGSVCGEGHIALAPPDVGLYALAFSSCVPLVSHPAMSGYGERVEQARAFYSSLDARGRSAFLERECVAVLVLPDAEVAEAGAWAAVTAPFRLAARAGGSTLFRRAPPCARPRPRAGRDSSVPATLLAFARAAGDPAPLPRAAHLARDAVPRMSEATAR